ncbi:unnamed protein product [Kuraishia capsulata CBS 1993]|uniref:Uncharacterized protein n=1 Tax=Kuraishia capsulata CBS 1993 TaxID=1382522 RepID=W6MN61_9ASCO|nr:unnamed protein product [Kuraishia capsulata CBS 1993]
MTSINLNTSKLGTKQ